MSAFPGIFGDKRNIGAMPLPGTPSATGGTASSPNGYNALDSAANNPPVALKIEDELGCCMGQLDPGGGGTATQTGMTAGRRKFRFVINNGTNTGAIVAGDVVYFGDINCGQISTSLTDSKRNLVAGVAEGAIASGNKGWVQYTGRALVKSTGTFVKGDVGVSDSTAKRIVAVTEGTAPTHIPVGIALEANDATSAGFTTCRLIIPE